MLLLNVFSPARSTLKTAVYNFHVIYFDAFLHTYTQPLQAHGYSTDCTLSTTATLWYFVNHYPISFTENFAYTIRQNVCTSKELTQIVWSYLKCTKRLGLNILWPHHYIYTMTWRKKQQPKHQRARVSCSCSKPLLCWSQVWLDYKKKTDSV